jgi:hypothetical protein
MLNCNLFENFDFNLSCFGRSRTIDPDDDEEAFRRAGMYKIGDHYRVSILPVDSKFEITNLVPLTNHVELWNVFVIGSDKTYVLAQVNDPYTRLPLAGHLPNRTGATGLPSEVAILFDVIWTKTLGGKQLQFFMSWNGRLYLVNTYPFYNGRSVTIGAVMFMRAFAGDPASQADDLFGPNEPRAQSVPAGVTAELESRIAASVVDRAAGPHITSSPFA